MVVHVLSLCQSTIEIYVEATLKWVEMRCVIVVFTEMAGGRYAIVAIAVPTLKQAMCVFFSRPELLIARHSEPFSVRRRSV